MEPPSADQDRENLLFAKLVNVNRDRPCSYSPRQALILVNPETVCPRVYTRIQAETSCVRYRSKRPTTVFRFVEATPLNPRDACATPERIRDDATHRVVSRIASRSICRSRYICSHLNGAFSDNLSAPVVDRATRICPANLSAL